MPQEKSKGDQYHYSHSEAEKHPNNKGDLKCDFKTNKEPIFFYMWAEY